MVTETCAMDLKTEIFPHKTLQIFELHHRAGRTPSPYPSSMAAALSPSSAACSVCPGPDPTADLSSLATTKASL